MDAPGAPAPVPGSSAGNSPGIDPEERTLRALERRAVDAEARLEAAQRAQSELTSKVLKAEQKAAAAESQIAYLKSDKSSLLNQTSRLSRDQRNLQIELQDARTFNEQLKAQLRECNSQKAKFESESNQFRSMTESSRVLRELAEANAEWAQNQMEERSRAAKRQLEMAYAQIKELENELFQKKSDADSAQSRLESQRTAVASLSKELEDKTTELNEARAAQRDLEREFRREVSSLEAKLDQAKNASNIVSGASSVPVIQPTPSPETPEHQRIRFQNEFAHVAALLQNTDRVREQYDRAVEEFNKVSKRCTALELEKTEVAAENNALNNQIKELESSLKRANETTRTLALQVQYLVLNAQLNEDDEPSLSDAEKASLQKYVDQPPSSSAKQILGERLAFFLDVAELQQQNEKQLAVLAQLTDKLEAYELQESSIESPTVAEAKRVISGLQAKLDETLATVEHLKSERDVFRDLNDGASELDYLKTELDTSRVEASNQEDLYKHQLRAKEQEYLKLETELSKLQAQLDVSRTSQRNTERKLLESDAALKELEMKLAQSRTESLQLRERVTQLTSEFSTSERTLSSLQSEKNNLESREQVLQTQITNYEREITRILEERSALDSSIRDLTSQLQTERLNSQSSQSRLLDQVSQLQSEKSDIRKQLEDMNAEFRNASSQLDTVRQSSVEAHAKLSIAQAATEPLKMKISSLEKELNAAEDRLSVRNLAFNDTSELELTKKQVNELRGLIGELQSSLREKEEKIAQTSSLLETEKSNAAELQKKFEELQSRPPPVDPKEYEKVKAQLANSVKAENDSKKALEDLQSKFNEVNATLDSARDKLSTTEQQLSTLQSEKSSTEASLRSELEKAKTTTSQLVDDKSKLATEVSEYKAKSQELSQRIDSLVDQHYEPLDAGTDEGEHPGGSANKLLVMLRDEKLKVMNQLQVAEEENVKLREEVSSTTAILEQRTQQVQTLEQELGNKPSSSEAVEELKRENEKIMRQFEEQATKLQESEKHVEKIQSEIAPLRKELLRLKVQLQSKTDQINLLESESGTVSAASHAELESTKKQLAEFESKMAEERSLNEDKLKRADVQRRNLLTQVATLNNQVNQLNQEISTKESQLQEAIASKDEAERSAKLAIEEANSKAEAEIQAAKSKEVDESQPDAQVNVATEEHGTLDDESVAQLRAEMLEKNKRIDYLEGEINRASDDIMDLETTKKKLADTVNELTQARNEIASLRSRVDELENAAKNSGDKSEKSDAEYDALKKKLADAEAKLNNMSYEMSSTEESDTVRRLGEELAAKSSQDEVGTFKSLLEQSFKNRLTLAVNSRLEEKSNEITALKAELKSIEERVDRKYQMRLKLLSDSSVQLKAKNEELKNAMRMVKGGGNAPAVMIMGDGTAKVVQDPPQQQHQQNFGQQQQRRQGQKFQGNKRPGVQRDIQVPNTNKNQNNDLASRFQKRSFNNDQSSSNKKPRGE